MSKINLIIICFLCCQASTAFSQNPASNERVFQAASERFQRNTHTVVLDSSLQIIPWTNPQSMAYDYFLRQRWNFIKTKVPAAPGPAPRSNYPQYYFYCASKPNNGVLEADTWMNDVGEKIPNWFESARLYYAYTGDTSVMVIMRDFIDYTITHGTSPADFDWPNFPYTTTNAGDLDFRGFTSTGRFKLHEVQVDHAADMGLAYFRMYQYSGNKKYLKAAVDVANTLVKKIQVGSATNSPWPYRVVMKDGTVVAPYGANWSGAYLLLDNLSKEGIGNVAGYRNAREKVRIFILNFPLKTGFWTDGHTDTDVKTNTYKSNLSASNFTLLMLDNPEVNPDWKNDIPKLIKWTEDNFVFRGDSSEPGMMWGAHIVGEQDGYLFKMDYQTARYGAECARWYSISGDADYKEKAYRSLNWVTYCNDSSGMAIECPLSVGIANWWSDLYGECPRMFYHALAAVPEWAPPGENHILYSQDIIKQVDYKEKKVDYEAAGHGGTDYIKLAFKPATISFNGKALPMKVASKRNGYAVKELAGGGYLLTINRVVSGKITINAR